MMQKRVRKYLPEPDFWMHQLGGVTVAPRLDKDKFIEALRNLLRKLESKRP